MHIFSLLFPPFFVDSQGLTGHSDSDSHNPRCATMSNALSRAERGHRTNSETFSTHNLSCDNTVIDGDDTASASNSSATEVIYVDGLASSTPTYRAESEESRATTLNEEAVAIIVREQLSEYRRRLRPVEWLCFILLGLALVLSYTALVLAVMALRHR